LTDDLVFLVGNLGFPIAVSVYLLIRVEGRLEAINGALKELKHNISRLL